MELNPQHKNNASTKNQNPNTTTTGQYQTMEYKFGRDEPVYQNLSAQAGQNTQRTDFYSNNLFAKEPLSPRMQNLVISTIASQLPVGASNAHLAYYGNKNNTTTPGQQLPANVGEENTTKDVVESAGVSTSPSNTYSGFWAGSEPIDSYEQFLRNKESGYGTIKDKTISFYDDQGQKALDAIEEQHQSATTYAGDQKTLTDNAATEQKAADIAEADAQKNLLIGTSEDQKSAAYDYAEDKRNAVYNERAFAEYEAAVAKNDAARNSEIEEAKKTIDDPVELEKKISEINSRYDALNQEEYDSRDFGHAYYEHKDLVDAINAQKETGMAMNEEQKQLLLGMSEEQRNNIYAAAERQRQAAEQRADVERKRGVVDARSSGEQNKASYGAKAEAMGKMGLSGGGYSDYLNSQAYAQQRAETQAANAQADASKREARYTEDQARLKADSDYYQKKYDAEKTYSDRKYEIDTTYQKNMLEADQNKSQRIFDAENAERDTKYSADSAHNQNVYNANSQYSRDVHDAESAERSTKLQSGLTYNENIFNADSQARSDRLAAEQAMDTGKFNAEMSYEENILNNDDAIAAHRLAQEEKAEEEANYVRGVYAELLSGANTGAYTADQLEQLAADYGLSPEQKQSLIDAASGYKTKSQASAGAEITAATDDTLGYIDSVVDSGAISDEEGQNKRFDYFADAIDTNSADTAEIDKAAENGDISPEQYADLQNKWNNSISTGSDTFCKEDGSMLTYSAAKELVDEYINHPWCSPKTKSELIARFNSQFSPSKRGANYNGSSEELADAGNNFQVTYDGTQYHVESAGTCTDNDVKGVASYVNTGEMFGYRGKIYIKGNGGTVYEIRARANTYGGEWNTLYSKFFS